MGFTTWCGDKPLSPKAFGIWGQKEQEAKVRLGYVMEALSQTPHHIPAKKCLTSLCTVTNLKSNACFKSHL